MDIPETFLNSAGVAVLGVVLTSLATWFGFQRSQAVKERDALAARVTELEAKERLAAAAFIPIASAFQAILIRNLTHAHTGELDALLVKVGEHTLLLEEEPRLLELLEQRIKVRDKRISKEEREDAMIFPIVMRRAREERALITRARETQLRPADLSTGIQ